MDAHTHAKHIVAEQPRPYRKKPVVITAVRYDGHHESAKVIAAWSGGEVQEHAHEGDGYRLVIATLEGEMQARPGDYVIRGVSGEFYPIKESIFWETYEAVS